MQGLIVLDSQKICKKLVSHGVVGLQISFSTANPRNVSGDIPFLFFIGFDIGWYLQ